MAKVTKSQIIEGLRSLEGNYSLSADVQAIVDYTLDTFAENPRDVPMDELKEVMKVVEEGTGKKFAEILAKSTGEAPKTEKAEPKKVGNKTAENSEKGKIIVPKVNKNEGEPIEEEKPKKATSSVAKPHQDYLAKFPETLVSKSLKGTLKIRRDLVTIQDVVKAYNNDEDIVIATYWTKKLLRQYAQSYDPMGINPNRPTSFEHDLDLIEITYANELVITGCSLYSYVPQIILPRDFEQDEDGMRYANGCEWEIYEVVSEE